MSDATTSAAPAASQTEVRLHRHPGLFYGLSIGIPWVLWTVAGVLSRRETQTPTMSWVVTGLTLAGLLAPIAVAFALIRRDPRLVRDTLSRLTGLRGASPMPTLLAVAVLPATLLIATAVSLLFGYPASQFQPHLSSSVTVGPIPGWWIVVLAPVVEELAWHSYGTDTLASRWSVWRTTVVFAVFWAVWHIPLGLIKGSYQAEVADSGWLASVNFLLSVFPLMLLMNWFYFRCRRNVWIAVLVHLSANVGNELFQTEPNTKVIQTGVLLIPCAWLLWRDRAFFFSRPEQS